jgi:putative spermidine/putrescine transport system substrate-binding protein
MNAARRRYAARLAVAVVTAALCVVAAGCGGGGDNESESKLPESIGAGEGSVSLVAWEGYAQDEWVKPFEQETGCKVKRKYAGSSDEMVTLMRSGAGYDLVSASGDASLRLIRGGDVQEVNPDLIPDYDNFIEALKSPPHNTVDDKHYGISLQWGPNTLLYNTEQVSPAPTSWGALYDEKYKGKITVPDNPIQIADAALYLSKTQPDLGIEDPYELTQEQFDAAVALLKQQKPLVKKYWALASDEIDLFKNGDAIIGASWPYQTNTLIADKVPVKDTIPKEGATGWADTWMLSSKSKHVNCAYLWMKHVSTPKVQAQQAIYFGETPANTKACAVMDDLSKGSCKQYHADAPESYFNQIKFWKTPTTDCGNGDNNCMDYSKWQQAWTEIRG